MTIDEARRELHRVLRYHSGHHDAVIAVLTALHRAGWAEGVEGMRASVRDRCSVVAERLKAKMETTVDVAKLTVLGVGKKHMTDMRETFRSMPAPAYPGEKDKS